MKIDALPDAEKYAGEEDKFQKYGSKNPGEV